MGRFGKPSKDHFAQMVMDGIRRAGETKAIQYDPDRSTLPDRPLRSGGNGPQHLVTLSSVETSGQ
jgi:hypothetical protein